MAERVVAARDPNIRAAKYLGQGAFTEYHVEDSPGLILAVLPPDGTKSERVWRVRYSIGSGDDRVQRRMRLGAYPGMSLAKARAKASAIFALVDEGRDPFKEAKAQRVERTRAALTFGELIADYLGEHGHLSSIGEVERELRRDVLDHSIATKPPAAITPADLDGLLRGIEARKSTETMATRIATRLNTIYRWVLDAPVYAEKYGITANPMDRLIRGRVGGQRRFRKNPPRTRFLSDDEIGAVWNQIEHSSYMAPNMKLQLRLMLLLGARGGDVRQMKWSDLMLDGPEPVWLNPNEKVQNRRPGPLAMPLSPLAIDLIKHGRTLARRSPWVMPAQNGEPAEDNAAAMAMSFMMETHFSDWQRATPHDIRRTVSTGLRALGFSRDLVGLILGHAKRGVTGEVYDQYEALPERREAMLAWARHIEKILRREA